MKIGCFYRVRLVHTVTERPLFDESVMIKENKAIGHVGSLITSTSIFLYDGVQDALYQNMAPWHNEYLKLSFRKWQK